MNFYISDTYKEHDEEQIAATAASLRAKFTRGDAGRLGRLPGFLSPPL